MEEALNILDLLFARYLLAPEGSVVEKVLENAITSWQKELEDELHAA